MRHLSLCEPSLKGRGRLAGLVSADRAKDARPIKRERHARDLLSETPAERERASAQLDAVNRSIMVRNQEGPV